MLLNGRPDGGFRRLWHHRPWVMSPIGATLPGPNGLALPSFSTLSLLLSSDGFEHVQFSGVTQLSIPRSRTAHGDSGWKRHDTLHSSSSQTVATHANTAYSAAQPTACAHIHGALQVWRPTSIQSWAKAAYEGSMCAAASARRNALSRHGMDSIQQSSKMDP